MASVVVDGGGLIVWTVVTFVCLFLLLSRFAFKPLGRILKEREDTIRDSMGKAREAREASERVLAENETRLGEAREETRRIISEGHRIVAGMKREATTQAKREAEILVVQARTDIDRELQRSLEELKGTVASLSVRISRQVLREKADDETHRRLADEFIERLKKTHAGRPSPR